MEANNPLHHYRFVFAKNMRTIRRLKNISQEELAFKAGISRVYIGEIEKGSKAVSIDIMGNIADALNLPLDQLLRTDLILIDI